MRTLKKLRPEHPTSLPCILFNLGICNGILVLSGLCSNPAVYLALIIYEPSNISLVHLCDFFIWCLIFFIFFFPVLNDMIEEMSQHLQEKYNIEELSHVAIPLQVISLLYMPYFLVAMVIAVTWMSVFHPPAKLSCFAHVQYLSSFSITLSCHVSFHK